MKNKRASNSTYWQGSLEILVCVFGILLPWHDPQPLVYTPHRNTLLVCCLCPSPYSQYAAIHWNAITVNLVEHCLTCTTDSFYTKPIKHGDIDIFLCRQGLKMNHL